MEWPISCARVETLVRLSCQVMEMNGSVPKVPEEKAPPPLPRFAPRSVQRSAIPRRTSATYSAPNGASQGGGKGVAEGEVGIGRLLPGLLPHAAVGGVKEAVEIPLRQPHALPG